MKRRGSASGSVRFRTVTSRLAARPLWYLLAVSVVAALLAACGDPSRPSQAASDQSPTTRLSEPSPRARADAAAVVTPTSESARTMPLDSSRDAEPGDFVQVATGENHWCGLRRDGKAICRGPNDQGQLNVPAGARFRQLSLGWRFSCGLQTDGQISCWGRNNHQQASPPDGQFTAIDAGWDHVCALSGTTATCWGRNADDRATPPAGVEFTAIGAGAEHSCGLTSVGGLICWGKNDNGRADSREGPFRALAVGIAHTCVLHADGTAACQGEKSAAQSEAPATAFVQISAGADHTCGILATGHLECWGGDPSGTGHSNFAPPGRYTSIGAGWNSQCAISATASITCWTSNHAARSSKLHDRLHLTIVADGSPSTNSVEILSWPSGGFAIAQRTGEIVALKSGFDAEPILDLTAIVDSDGAEMGLLSIAVDPQFDEFKFIYVYYTTHNADDPHTAIARLSRFSEVDGRVDRLSELVILDVPRSTQSELHWGGAIRFGPDGMLHLGIGDSLCLECPQDLGTLHGKIIRIDIRDASIDQPYRIPDDNPFVGVPEARPEVWAYGLRNPWRMSFDYQSGELWVGDVGNQFEEEISVATPGANLGWPILEGTLCSNVEDFSQLRALALEQTSVNGDHPCKEIAQLSAPIVSYRHGAEDNCAVVGGLVYRGEKIPWLGGTYFFGDFCSGRVWALDGDPAGGWHMIQIADLDRPISSFGRDADGELLVLTFGGSILRLTEADAGFAPSVTHIPSLTTVTTPSQASGTADP